jgi:pimeloyl-ACP methyl ester carboxylesterase
MAEGENAGDAGLKTYDVATNGVSLWAAPDYVGHNVAEFKRTGFHGGLNYYRAAEPYFSLSAAFKGAKISQPSFFIWGKADGLKELYPLTMEQKRAGLPGLVGALELDNVGH